MKQYPIPLIELNEAIEGIRAGETKVFKDCTITKSVMGMTAYLIKRTNHADWVYAPCDYKLIYTPASRYFK